MVNYYIKIFHPFTKLEQNPLIHINLFYNSFMPFLDLLSFGYLKRDIEWQKSLRFLYKYLKLCFKV